MEKEKNVPLLLTLSSKRCSCCGEVKPTTEFTRQTKHGKVGFYCYCRECKHKKTKEYYIDNPEKYNKLARNRKLKMQYGLTPEDLERMLRDQGNKCVICGRELFLHGSSAGKRNIAHVDHDHKTGKVRGLLCQECNIGLGKFMDNTDYLLSAISYLKKNK